MNLLVPVCRGPVVLFAVVLLPMLSMGCTVPQHIGSGVTRYCETTSPLDRAAMRARVNTEATPHRVEVICAD